ncbi:recombinase family protein [Alkaliphilus serpentinus]|nr:recombinase family protein [Alkaliphilus serpentinus]
MRVCGYVRISRDEDKENYSSIIQQKELIYQKAQELGYTIDKIYEDDNVSGYTFDRVSFNSLVEDIKSGKVNFLLTKDSSRIGRHNAKTLLFFELLDQYETRLILINENYDSRKDSDDILGLRTWYNEMYVKDISRKIIGSIRSKQKNGGLVIRNTFGYQKDKNLKHKLLIDEEAAETVRYIFSLYIQGWGYRKISAKLNEEKIPTPSQYKKSKDGSNIQVAQNWNPVHVQRIIQNDIYTGVLRCKKTIKKRIKGESVKIPEDQHIIYKNHHPAIVSEEDYKIAMEIAEKRVERKIKGGSKGINLFSGFLYCSKCGSYMIMRKRKERHYYYCGKYHQLGRDYCSGHNISGEEIQNIIIDNLKKILILKPTAMKELEKTCEIFRDVGNIQKALKKINKDIDIKRNELKSYTKLYSRGRLEESLYRELMDEGEMELESMMSRFVTYNNKVIAMNNVQKISINGIINDIIRKKDLERQDLEILIDKILVGQSEDYPDGIYMKIFWNFNISTMRLHTQGDVKLDQGPLIYTLDP